jgi:hypothetical protein
MKPTRVDHKRRKFFATMGIGFLAGGLISTVTGKLFQLTGKKEVAAEKKVSVSINPMAVKRTSKG